MILTPVHVVSDADGYNYHSYSRHELERTHKVFYFKLLNSYTILKSGSLAEVICFILLPSAE